MPPLHRDRVQVGIHIGLPGTNPDVASQDVIELNRLLTAMQSEGLAVGICRQRRHDQAPCTGVVGIAAYSQALPCNYYLSASCRRAPQNDRLIPLQHHVVRKNWGHFELRSGEGCNSGKKESEHPAL